MTPVGKLSIGVILAALGFASPANADLAFVKSPNKLGSAHAIAPLGGRLTCRAPTYSSNPAPLRSKFDSNGDVFLLNFDGTLASTNRSRSLAAICVALKVWPTLRSNAMTLGMDPDDFDWERDGGAEDENDGDRSREWLLRKLSALSSITQQGNSPDAMLGCDSVLLARLLLEEQLLDGGRSNGRGGKYGGKFHPPSSASEDGGGPGGRPKVGSRPLTVGELYANWEELRDVTRMKYPFTEKLPGGKVMRKDPLPEIRHHLKELLSVSDREEMQRKFLPSWQSLAYDILFDYSCQSNDGNISLRQNTMLLLGHDSQVPWVLTTLSSLGCAMDVKLDLELLARGGMANNLCMNVSDAESNGWNVKVIVTTSDKAQKHIMQQQEECGKKEGASDHTKPSLLVVVPNLENEESHSNMIERIVTDFNSNETELNRNVYVTHSSLEVLKQCKSFLGDDAPMLSQGLRKCILPHTKTAVTLFVPEWADNIHPSQQNDAEMDPWLNLVSEEQFLELISARIVEASLA
eukprot:CAMPEP_0172547274 /NCGR_PEP_ID=MMETSP1067-20121228/16849_1 /TAXON_ID=265564 ORGANISM="Thalassiosira punctigera, Strain Tpunct2005C2" /NCGR_SAMPLE_ID=MMETSP1067 /ASSEMBLY_ACC=CAM_ASM_000444 /LENGTH=519 /DNA_ID=CAMNT_0013334341 /DNA_START=177 /DNA_END=1736 /DNA_ORIENTATION=+